MKKNHGKSGHILSASSHRTSSSGHRIEERHLPETEGTRECHTKEQFMNMNYYQRLALMHSDPEEYHRMKKL